MYKLNKLLEQNYNICTALHVFDHTIKPIILYASEVWAVELASTLPAEGTSWVKALEKNPISQIELKFYRRLLQVKRHTPILGIRGELGRHPLILTAILNSVKYLHTIRAKPSKKLVKEALAENHSLHSKNKKAWLSQLESITEKMHININNIQPEKLKTSIKKIERNLIIKYESLWHDRITDPNSLTGQTSGNKLRTYQTFKQNFALEKYLLNTDNINHRRAISKIRLSSHPLNIESKRGTITDPNNRFCPFCQTPLVENEEHFLMSCSLYFKERENLLNIINQNTNVQNLTNNEKFIWLMSNEDKKICKALGKFIADSLSARTTKINEKKENNKPDD